MAKRIPLATIRLVRADKDGKNPQRITPEIGKPFDFTDKELKELAEIEKRDGLTLLRKPLNEDVVETTNVQTQNATGGVSTRATTGTGDKGTGTGDKNDKGTGEL